MTQELKTARWEKLVGDPDGALRAFARGQRVIGANSNVVAQDGTLGLTPTGCKIGQLVKETPHLCDLRDVPGFPVEEDRGQRGAEDSMHGGR